MKPETRELARYRMERAGQTREEAEILFSNGKYNGAMNRIYYSIFYAVGAVLILEGLSSAKHSGTISLFLSRFVKENKAPEETGKFLRDMFKFRSRGDYDDFTEFTSEQVSESLRELDVQLSTLELLLEKMMREDTQF